MIGVVVRSALRFRGLVVGIAAAIIVIGVVTLRDAPVDVLPEFTPAYVEIQTESLGLSAAEVEQLLTVPLEADLLNGVEGVDVIRSSSLPGLSSIVLVFEPGTDLYKGRQLVQERLTQLGGAAFPNVSKPPTMLQPLSSSSRVMMIGLSSESLTPIQKSVLARWTLRPRLMGVEGVANVAVWGMRDQQIQVQVDPERLRDKNVRLSQVVSTAGNAQIASPVSYLEASVPGTGGFIETPQQRLQVRNVFDKIADPKELGKVTVEGSGGKLRLSDVANVVQNHQPLIGDAVVNDKDGLLLVVEKFPGADAKDVSEGVEDALEKLAPGLSGLQTDTSVFRPADLIDEAVGNLRTAIIIGALLLVLALVAVLMRWRTVLIVLVTIPTSLVAAAIALDLLGETFNAITFAGLALALAIIVDDAVTGAENIARRLAQRRAAGSEVPVATTVLDATREIRSPLGYATLIALLVIVPVAIVEGRPGAFLAPLAIAYAVAVVTATIMALTLTPALAALLKPAEHGSPLLTRLAGAYGALLGKVIGRPAAALAGVAVLGLAVVVALPLMGLSLLPTLKDRNVLVRLDAQAGTSNPRMTAIATELSRDLRRISGVQNVGGQVGRAVTGDRIVDVNSAEVVVSMKSGADYDETRAAIDAAVGRVEGARAQTTTYSAQKLRDVGALTSGENPATGDGLSVLTGEGKPLTVRLYGQDLATLQREGANVRRLMNGIDGVVGATVERPTAQPTLRIEVDLDRARRFGVKPGDVRRSEAILLQGILVGNTFEEQKVFDVMVQGDPKLATSQAAVRNLLIDRPDGGHVRLSQVADVRVASTPTVIKREGVSRKLDIQAGVEGRSVADVRDEVRERLADLPLPLEYHARVLDRSLAEEINQGQVIGFALAAALAIFLLMQAALRSWRLAVLAFVSLPVALAGGVLGALLLGSAVTLGVLVGLMALLGLAARNTIVLLRHFQRLEQVDEVEFDEGLVRRGAQERLTPVLAGTAALAAALLPFVLMGSPPGLEVVHPMAVVVLCGLATSTALSLFVLPTLYLRFETGRPRPVLESPADDAQDARELAFEFGDESSVTTPAR
ncbi:MAG: efflux RND transporter permease subunit [Solirubrobacteraceae bacterium]|nr:efflux RND transporter permease subunit [Solirubrobacteraceae bacterium]